MRITSMTTIRHSMTLSLSLEMDLFHRTGFTMYLFCYHMAAAICFVAPELLGPWKCFLLLCFTLKTDRSFDDPTLFSKPAS